MRVKNHALGFTDNDQLPDYDFKLFFAIWVAQLHFNIPDVHMQMLDFLSDEQQWNNRTKVLLLWRGVGKTLMICAYAAYRLSIDPTLRILMLCGAGEESVENVSSVLNIINLHPLCKHLINNKNETRRSRFFVNGYSDANNPSIKSKTITGTTTAGRSDLIIYDDVEIPRTTGSEIKRKDLRRRISESKHTLIPGTGKMIYVGTYHDPISIYDEAIEAGSSYLRVPMLQNAKGEWPYMTGDLQWPERFDAKVSLQIQKDCGGGKSEFYSQYLLIPTGIEDARFDVEKLNIYNKEIEFISANGRILVKLGDREIAGVSAFWDPSSGIRGRDKSVVGLVLTDFDGNLFVHRVIDVGSPDYDEQARNVKKIAFEFHLPTIVVEENGLGIMISQILKKHCIPVGIGVIGKYTTGNKQVRILESMETALFSGRLFIHDSVVGSPFYSQMRDFDPLLQQQSDDFIDAVANAIRMHPCRINVLYADQNAPVPGDAWGFESSFEIQEENYEW